MTEDLATVSKFVLKTLAAALASSKHQAMGKSSHMVARLEEDNGSWNVSWNRVVMNASGVAGDDRGVLAEGRHLLSITRLACFSSFGSR